jgi:hypothetical protein
MKLNGSSLRGTYRKVCRRQRSGTTHYGVHSPTLRNAYPSLDQGRVQAGERKWYDTIHRLRWSG